MLKLKTMQKIKIPKEPPYTTCGIVNLPTGTYVCPGWHPVPSGTTREDIELVEADNTQNVKSTLKTASHVKKEQPKKKAQTWHIKSSNGKKTYIIKNLPVWDCTCPAFQFQRGDCKHIKKIKKDLN